MKLFGIRIVYRRVYRRRRRRTVTAVSKKAFEEHKAEALRIAVERVEHFNQHYGFTVGMIRIKNQATRWGSCSKKGNLNFNYKLALLPSALQDYLIVHELCHLGEFNHSRSFWALVAQMIPDHVELRRQLRQIKN